MPKPLAWCNQRLVKPSNNWVSPEKKTTRYVEADEEQRKAFKQALETLTEEQGVYLDECGIDPHLNREFGWAPRHEKVLGKIPGKRESKFNLIAVLNSAELKAPLIYQGTMNTALFNTYLEEFLLPVLTPGQVVIMDNATFHKSKDTHRLITEKNCQVWYLPPYSPDLNPIEHTWAILKRYVRRYRNQFDSLALTLDFIFHSIPLFAGK